MQKSVSVQPPEDGLLSLDDSGYESISYQRSVRTDWVRETFFCKTRVYGRIPGYHTRLGQCYGVNE